MSNQIQLTLIGESGVPYVVESSSDLRNWTSVATNADIGISRAIMLESSLIGDFYRARRGTLPLFNGALVCAQNISFNGNTELVDSFDSSDPNSSTNGMYDPAKRYAGGDVACAGLAAVGSCWINGHLYSGAYTLGPAGGVGDLSWAGPGIEPGWYRNDFLWCLPDVVPPYTTGLTPGSQGTNTYWLGSNDYYISGDFKIKNNQTMYVAGNARFYVTGSFTMANNSTAQIVIGPGATLQLLVGAATGLSTVALTSVVAPVPAANFQVYGLPSVGTVSWIGIGAYVGAIYAPEAVVTLSGGGNNTVDFQGSIVGLSMVINGRSSLHFDESLLRTGPFR